MTIPSAPLQRAAQIDLVAVCHDCRKRHEISADPSTWLARLDEWRVKHQGHRFEFRSPRRVLARGFKDRWVYPILDRWGRLPWWLGAYTPNADIKVAYAASASYTITLAGLGYHTTMLNGRSSAAVNNTSNLYLDYLVGGKATTGTGPGATGQIRVYAYGSWNDTPAYPDVLDGTDSNKTITSTDIRDQLPLVTAMITDSTSNRTYAMSVRALSSSFSGIVPKYHGLFVTHNTGVALNATAGNHDLVYTGVYATG